MYTKDTHEKRFWRGKEKFDRLSWSLGKLESNKRFGSSPTKFRSEVIKQLKTDVKTAEESIPGLKKLRPKRHRTDGLVDTELSPRQIILVKESASADPNYLLLDGTIIFGKPPTRARPKDTVSPILSHKHAFKELTDTMAANMKAFNTNARTGRPINEYVTRQIWPKKGILLSVNGAHIDDCYHLIRTHNKETPGWKLLADAVATARTKFLEDGGQREDWVSDISFGNAICRRYFQG